LPENIDLHTHSTASDGSLSPIQLVDLAKSIGLSALALTDHDTVEGNAEAIAEADKQNLRFVPGVEISCDFRKEAIHILGYWIDYRNSILRHTLKELVQYRTQRNHLIISKLQALNIAITYEEVSAIAGNEVVGRPHFAQVLVNKGAADSVKDAFNRFLAPGKSAYVPKKRLSAKQGIELILQAKGFPCLAHPGQYDYVGEEVLKQGLRELIGYGLQGLEVYYSTHTAEQTGLFLKFAEQFDLAVSGGSDFHGDTKPEVKLGSGVNGRLKVPYELLKGMEERLSNLKRE
jgi:predicted metal-dependent phosphoesterase TrpH